MQPLAGCIQPEWFKPLNRPNSHCTALQFWAVRAVARHYWPESVKALAEDAEARKCSAPQGLVGGIRKPFVFLVGTTP
jgi:hypothetical protein